jgi:prepilin-type N-terminal cleavage/methylation domain-containing protein
MEKGFSLVELMVVITIVAIVTTFAVPSYAKYTERSRSRGAEANLMVIHNMEKRYKLDNGTFFECQSSPCPGFACPATAGCSINVINTGLGLFIKDPYFTYKIAINGAGYIATATRLATGTCANKTMTVTDASSTITKDCTEW